MKLTKYTHACVRLDKDGKVLLIDPGSFSEDAVFEAADAVLVTHEHPDHLDVQRIKALDAPVYTTAGVAAQLTELGERVHVVAHGQAFDAAGFAIHAYGKDHAIILPELGVPCENVGFLVEDAVYHPGDSFTRPDRQVHTNLVPISGPWFSLPPAVEYARSVTATQLVGIHDALLSPIGQGLLKRFFDDESRPYHGLTPGESLEVN
ncbi:Zn-dependent hydrolase-like protein of the beta-lactamase fold family [Kribbella flavida DSM 17836]|uniref:Zn-dependent hydrolase-like protein of the beta-lactamase fold family n=1 Tax=Kribbella flavida (strain DSM 17836 / JCM 10339 / NBRC 14399) TaxID=479435 RepID=D2PVR5_KRIFD|nr:MBL fold metallo-hydrolase [Kribbella flavida]ADB35305.1 Zn-dependent hydrolase-like protein of the beta-lactamase fold family [Kribbella flavida DSM 17836]